MKRILPLILTILLIPGLLAVPARADEYSHEEAFLNVMDYLDPSILYQVVVGDNSVSFALPTTTFIEYVDIVLYAPNGINSVLYWHPNLGWQSISCESIGSGYYRVFGSVPSMQASEFWLSVNSPSSAWFRLCSFKLSSSSALVPFRTQAAGNFTVHGTTYQFTQTEPGAVAVVDFPAFSITDPYERNFVLKLKTYYYWNHFDYIDYVLELKVTDISSISARLFEENIPCDITYLGPSSNSGVYRFIVTLDLRYVDRTSEYEPELYITGSANTMGGQVKLLASNGYVIQEAIDPDFFWFGQVRNWFSNLSTEISIAISGQTAAFTSGIASWFTENIGAIALWGQNVVNQISSSASSITGTLASWFTENINAISLWGQNVVNSVSSSADRITGSIASWFTENINAISVWGQNIVDAIVGNRDGSQLQDDLNNAVGGLQQAGQAMDSVQRPDIGQFNFDVSALVPTSGVSAVGSLVGLVYQNQVFGPIMLMFFTLSLAAFVIFGRR